MPREREELVSQQRDIGALSSSRNVPLPRIRSNNNPKGDEAKLRKNWFKQAIPAAMTQVENPNDLSVASVNTPSQGLLQKHIAMQRPLKHVRLSSGSLEQITKQTLEPRAQVKTSDEDPPVDPIRSYKQLKSYLTRKYLTNNKEGKRERFDI